MASHSMLLRQQHLQLRDGRSAVQMRLQNRQPRHRRCRLQAQPPRSLFQPNAVGPPGTTAAPMRDDQRFQSLLPPVRGRATKVEQLADGLWTATQPLLLPGGDAGLRLTAMRMADGSLWVHNPVAPTGELLAALADMGGPVSHIVVPNGSPEHWYFLGGFAQHFPDATVWTPPGFFSGRKLLFPSPGLGELKESGRIRTYGDEAPAEWRGEAAVALLDTLSLLEGAFLLPAHNTLLLSDTCIMIDEDWSGTRVGEWISKRLGVWKRLGPFFLRIFDRHPEGTRAWAQRILGFDFDTIISSHVVAPIPDGKAQFAACFPELADQQAQARPAAAESVRM